MLRAVALALFLVFALAGCGGSEPTTADLTPAQRDDLFWTAYEQRLGMVGRDYADPVAAKRESIEFGHVICAELDKGADRGVVQSRLIGSLATADEARVKVDTAVEFLCPRHAAE